MVAEAALPHAAPRRSDAGDRLAARFAGAWQAERDRWRLWLPVGLGLGIEIYFTLGFEPWPGFAPLAALLAGVAAWRLARAAQMAAALRSFAISLAVSLAVVACGFALAQFQTIRAAAPALNRVMGSVPVEGSVVQIDQLDEGMRLLLAPSRIGALPQDRLPHFVRVKLHAPPDPRFRAIEIGDLVALEATLMPPPGPSLPGGFDFQRQAYFERLGAVGYSLGEVRIRRAGASGWRGRILALRQAMAARIRDALPGVEGSIAAAMITGQRSAIPPAINQDFQNSGLAHLLVIAGLHMSLATGCAFFVCRAALALWPAVALRYPIKKWAALAALSVATAYLIISGGAIPTERAFVMTVLVLGAVLTDRLHASMNGVAIAALIVLASDPVALTGVSFQMSFAAVLGLVAFYEAASRYRGRRDAAPSWPGSIAFWLGRILLGVALTTIVATLATAPFALYHFNRIAVFSIVANLIAVPLAAFWIMPWALASCLLMPVGAERIGLIPMGWGLRAVEAIAHATSGLPEAVLTAPAMPDWGLGLIALGGLWLCLWRTGWRFLGLALIAAGLASFATIEAPDVLIAPDGRLFALRAAPGVYRLSSERAERMVADAWARALPHAAWLPLPRRGWPDDGADALVCGALSCRWAVAGQRVVLAPWRRAPKSCPEADLILAATALDPACRASRRVIDAEDSRAGGAFALWLGAGIRVEASNEERGLRPWVIRERAPRDAAAGLLKSSGHLSSGVADPPAGPEP